ncbi:MAG: hypothetical protein HS132_06090 [Planctomycetia bacterium]|nr:hypothetical protein [Planctomycetia bacterium]
MFDPHIKKLCTHLILDPYRLVDLRFLISHYRQIFINSTLKLLDHKKEDERLEKRKILKEIYAEIHEKRVLLDDLERAFELAAENNYEFRGYCWNNLDKWEKNDLRYEEYLKDVENNSEKMSEIQILKDINIRLAKIFFCIDKMNWQKKRQLGWELSAIEKFTTEEFKQKKPD